MVAYFTLAGGDGRKYIVMLNPEPNTLPHTGCVVIETVVNGSYVRCCDAYPLSDASSYRDPYMPDLRKQNPARIKGVLLTGPNLKNAEDALINVACRLARCGSRDVFPIQSSIANDN